MIAEINYLPQWIPEQMSPGTVFVLDNAGETGDERDPYWAVLACPSLCHPGPDHSQTDGRNGSHYLRLGSMLRPVSYPRRRHRAETGVLGETCVPGFGYSVEADQITAPLRMDGGLCRPLAGNSLRYPP